MATFLYPLNSQSNVVSAACARQFGKPPGKCSEPIMTPSLPWLLIRFRILVLPNFDPFKKRLATTHLVGNRPLLQTLLLTL